jgi:hypothetical protein
MRSRRPAAPCSTSCRPAETRLRPGRLGSARARPLPATFRFPSRTHPFDATRQIARTTLRDACRPLAKGCGHMGGMAARRGLLLSNYYSGISCPTAGNDAVEKAGGNKRMSNRFERRELAGGYSSADASLSTIVCATKRRIAITSFLQSPSFGDVERPWFAPGSVRTAMGMRRLCAGFNRVCKPHATGALHPLTSVIGLARAEV